MRRSRGNFGAARGGVLARSGPARPHPCGLQRTGGERRARREGASSEVKTTARWAEAWPRRPQARGKAGRGVTGGDRGELVGATAARRGRPGRWRSAGDWLLLRGGAEKGGKSGGGCGAFYIVEARVGAPCDLQWTATILGARGEGTWRPSRG
jgi:hypothetical protein